MSERVYLDTYVLQQDMRVRLPKTILNNLNISKGTSEFDVYIDVKAREIVLKVKDEKDKGV